MQRTATPFDLTEVNEGFSSLREHSSTPWYRSAFHVFAQAADAALTTAIPLVATNYVADLLSGAYSYHYSGYRDTVTPLFPGEYPTVRSDYVAGIAGALVGIVATVAPAAIAVQRGADFLVALGGRFQHAAGVVHASTSSPYLTPVAEAGVSALASAWFGDARYYPLVAATVSGMHAGLLATVARGKPNFQSQSPLRVPPGREVDFLTRSLDARDMEAVFRQAAVSAAVGYEHFKANIAMPCIDAIDKPIVGGDGRPSVTVHGAAGGCEVELVSDGTACAKTSFCNADEARGKVSKGGALTLSACYPTAADLASLRDPYSRFEECKESAYWFHVNAKYPTSEPRTRPEFLSEESWKAADWSGVGISQHSPPFHGPTMQVNPLPDNRVAVSGVGLPNSTMSIIWPDHTQTFFDVPSSPIGFRLQDFSVMSPGPQPAGLVKLLMPSGYGPIEVALHNPLTGAPSSTDTRSPSIPRLGALAATTAIHAPFSRREAHTSAEVESSLSTAFAEYLRQLPGESVSPGTKEPEEKRLQAECRKGLTILSKAIATHVEGESIEYAGRVYGLLVRELISAMGMHDTLGTALNTQPGHLSGVMSSHLGARTGAVTVATRQALAQSHGALLRAVFRDGKKVNAMGWLDDFAQFTKKAVDSAARQTANSSTRGLRMRIRNAIADPSRGGPRLCDRHSIRFRFKKLESRMFQKLANNLTKTEC